jgi:hypothetical protein
MSVRQLHYTSCEDGLEGIQGFQVSALTPGAPKPLVELAVRASAYTIGPGLAANGDLSRFPVAFGYVPSGDAATVFQSRYTGADFTGRMGNYFAHALLIDDVTREFADGLPIDLWRNPAWVHAPQGTRDLPELPGVPPGAGTDVTATRRFVTGDGRLAKLEQVLSAVQRVLTSGRGRLVLVVPDDESAARWLAAACRSLPRSLALRISFITYTARPEDTDVLIGCTTPDVRLPSYGEFTPLDLTATASPDPDSTRYASVLTRLWDRDAVAVATRLAAQADPQLAADDLEPFAVLLEMTTDLRTAVPPDEPLLLDAVRLAVNRMANALPEQTWQRISDHVLDCGGPADVAAWCDVLRTARGQGEPIPSALFGTYFIAALKSPERLWLPRLTAAELEDVAENVVLPGLGNPRLTERLDEQRDLFEALVRVLDRRLADQREGFRLATTLPVAAARLLAGAGTGRITLLTDLVLARHGAIDPVKVLCEASRVPAIEWRHLGTILWPEALSTEDCRRLLKVVPPDVLGATGLTSRITEQALKESALADELLRSPVARQLSTKDETTLRAATRIQHFRKSSPTRTSGPLVQSSLDMAASLPEEAAAALLASIAAFVLRADPLLHSELLDLAMDGHADRFLPVYHDTARTDLATARPELVAAAIIVWRNVEHARTRQRLTEETLAAAVARRKRKHLDRIGDLLKPTADKLGVSPPKQGWRPWWQSWRAVHERRGLLARFGLRRR